MPRALSKRQIVGIALALTMNMKKRKRKVWTKEWLLKRSQLSQMNVLQELDADEFKVIMRMDLASFNELLQLVKPLIEKQDTTMRQAVTAEKRLIATLIYLATGAEYSNLKFRTGISAQSLSIIIPETCRAIHEVLKHHIQLPKTENEWLDAANQFETKWHFNHCIGSMGGKHISIVKPSNSDRLFFNYKGTCSIVVFAVVNANYEFQYVHSGTNGSASDEKILKNTDIYKMLVDNQLNVPAPSILPGSSLQAPYVFAGDSALGLDKHIITPYLLEAITESERIFNYRLSRAKTVVENAFGILASRFQIFQKQILIQLESVDKVVMACCALHNFLINKSDYLTNACVDQEDFEHGVVIPGDWRQQTKLTPLQNITKQESPFEDVRETFMKYFNESGSVSFQDKMVNSITKD